MTTRPDIRLRRATAADAGSLSALALRSKAHWGYSDQMLAAFRAELTVTPDHVSRCATVIIECDGRIAGFYSLEAVDAQSVELAHLFVEPAHIGCGLGRALIEHALVQARRAGHRLLVIEGDPNAGQFYLAAGARRVGSRESASIAGRMLPVYEIAL